jgi:nicotinate-nucleotide pyrophosphorylase (carboxylating)
VVTQTSPPATRKSHELPDVSSEELRTLIENALAEDLGQGDLTTRVTLPEALKARGTLLSKQTLVVAGLAVAGRVFQVLDDSTTWDAAVEDGQEVAPGTALAVTTGCAFTLLAGERVALNILQHLCGVATQTWLLKQQIAGLRAELLDTRKTLPGLRALEKYAVRVGGGRNHRMRLDDGILIKSNHLRLAGGVRAAVENARRHRPAGFPIEVEITSLAELEEAIAASADAVLLDNLTPDEVRQCVTRAQGRVQLEVSGGVNIHNIRAYAETGVDRISVGALTHSAPAVDINFRIEPLEQVADKPATTPVSPG